MDTTMSIDGKRCCVFCGATGNLTSEHIWGDWTRKYVPREQNKHDFRAVVAKTPTSETAEPVRIRAGDPLNSQVKVVCQSCNNGWLSQIQAKAKPHLIPLVEGRDAYLGRQAQRQIATWATMATMTGEYLSRDPENVAVPQSERTKFMQTSRPLKNWRIWISKYEREEWKGQWRHNSFPIYPAAEIAEVLTSVKRKPNYQTTSFVVGKLYVHTFSGQASDLIMRWDWQNAPRALDALRQIWPLDKDVLRWPAATMNDQDASGIATAFIRRSAEIATQAGWYPFAQSG
jgi:hypothetical protein